MKNKQDRHGSARDRGRADYYYGRPYDPHYYKGDSFSSELVEHKEMTEEEVNQYTEDYQDQLDGQKDWGTEGYATIMEDGYGGENEPFE